MKIKINKNGSLFIDLEGKYKAQWCPYSSPTGDWPCGYWCPHFGEPDIKPPINYWPSPDRPCEDHPSSESTLSLCHGTVLTGEIVDERKP